MVRPPDLDVLGLVDREGDRPGDGRGVDPELGDRAERGDPGVAHEDVQAAEALDGGVIVLISWLSRLDDAEVDERGPRLLSILVDSLRARA
ncbi:hypothetical protein GCM10027598_07960 [Amycolatopsis oliviviridis]|uniref:Uncharacterized protein n=1 Tax=Amycolatopsis oliviviridis TaxID=1471590 RepID=A0ABQ3LMW2_9PSEU|nr:hypothetical protein [Amycolatopsis oliviviridis]GHH20916.1 hypothetical protein GCM10017790_41370 [Amycolatopsis oliviviridis]